MFHISCFSNEALHACVAERGDDESPEKAGNAA
jgi:hypothetical protein